MSKVLTTALALVFMAGTVGAQPPCCDAEAAANSDRDACCPDEPGQEAAQLADPCCCNDAPAAPVLAPFDTPASDRSGRDVAAVQPVVALAAPRPLTTPADAPQSRAPPAPTAALFHLNCALLL